jgi:hypothetical protein
VGGGHLNVLPPAFSSAGWTGILSGVSGFFFGCLLRFQQNFWSADVQKVASGLFSKTKLFVVFEMNFGNVLLEGVGGELVVFVKLFVAFLNPLDLVVERGFGAWSSHGEGLCSKRVMLVT